MTPSALLPLALRFLGGFLLLCGSALGWPSALLGANSPEEATWLIDLPLGMSGFWLALQAVAPLTQLWYRQQQLRRRAGRGHHAGFDDVPLPRQLFLLLLAVARADREVGAVERELVRRFLLARFPAPALFAELQAWEAAAVASPDLVELAARLALQLGPAECATVFSWACTLSFADGGFHPQEHEALQRVARGFGLAPDYARALFRQARDRFLRNRQAERMRQQRQRQGAAYEHRPTSQRQRALDILGLDESASPEAIRRRHRQLVKQFHPDAQPKLGPVAQQEATERFRAIQRAYELLTS